jgi:hypothetical protein
MMQLNPDVIKRQIENLKVSYPDLAGDDESWQMSLESETDLAELLTNLVRKIDDAKALVIGTKDRFEELEQRKARFEHRIDALRQLAFKLMQSSEVTKLELPEATLSLRNGAQQLVGEADAATLPDERETIGTDKKLVLYFKGKEKGLVLNKTNAGTIGDGYGDDTDDWFDNPLILFSVKTDYQGKVVDAIRCRVPTAKDNRQAPPERKVDPISSGPDDFPGDRVPDEEIPEFAR